MAAKRTPGQRAGLDGEQVLAAARALVAEGGLDALSMRALARRLGVTPNALYSHVTSKTALVDALLDDTLSEVPEPGAGEEPLGGLLALMTATYDVLLRHPDLVPLYLSRQGARGPNARRLGAVMLGMLERAGIAPNVAQGASRVLIIHTIGCAAFAAGADREVPLDQAALRAGFTSGLRWLVDGVVADGRRAD